MILKNETKYPHSESFHHTKKHTIATPRREREILFPPRTVTTPYMLLLTLKMTLK